MVCEMNNVLKKDDAAILIHKNDPYHLIRHRINVFITNAIANNPVTIVCAGTGCGKTRAVSDFLRLVCDSSIIVYDDLNFCIESEVHSHLENIINGATPETPKINLILIYRDTPDELKSSINALYERNLVSKITEADLNFTEAELITCLKQQNITLESHIIREIHKDTGGWSLAVNLAVRSLKRFPEYTGYVQTRLKPNIFELMELENWRSISENLQHFLVCLSLLDRHYIELVYILSDGNDDLLFELKQQNAYINSSNNDGFYLIHHLYLDFLRSKQNTLSHDEKLEIYKIADYWCNKNKFNEESLAYQGKIAKLKL
jgi:LuxR family maltose regulon positive regulatory protein